MKKSPEGQTHAVVCEILSVGGRIGEAESRVLRLSAPHPKYEKLDDKAGPGEARVEQLTDKNAASLVWARRPEPPGALGVGRGGSALLKAPGLARGLERVLSGLTAF